MRVQISLFLARHWVKNKFHYRSPTLCFIYQITRLIILFYERRYSLKIKKTLILAQLLNFQLISWQLFFVVVFFCARFESFAQFAFVKYAPKRAVWRCIFLHKLRWNCNVVSWVESFTWLSYTHISALFLQHTSTNDAFKNSNQTP